jgi:hypothetical protein
MRITNFITGIIICFNLLFTYNSFSTPQIPDIIIYKGETHSLFYCPLEFYPDSPLITSQNLFGGKGCFFSACWRNYVATWIIQDNKLYLINIRNACYPTNTGDIAASFKSKSDSIGNEYADLKKLFHDKYRNGKVYADWVTGKMIMPVGKLLFYVHDHFESVYEKEKELTIANGLLLSVNEFDNSKTKESSYHDQILVDYIYNKINWDSIPDLKKERIKVFISFSGNENGVIDSISVLRGYNKFYDSIAIAVIKSIPYWDIKYRHGKFERTIWNIPVVFSEEQRKKYNH